MAVLDDRILVIFPGALGDFICFLPALHELAAAAEVDLFTHVGYGELLSPRIRVRSLDRSEVALLFAPRQSPDARVEALFPSYASIYSWMGSADANFALNLRRLSRDVRLFPFRPAAGKDRVADYYLSCLGKKAPAGAQPRITLSAEAAAWSEEFLQIAGADGRRTLALAPGSGAREKNWPLPYFKAVARWWESALHGRALAIAGPVEEERGEDAAFEGHAIAVKGLGLAKLAALLSRCRLYVGNDSGVTHLAAAVGTPTVALFGPTDPRQWRPRGEHVTLVRLGVECSPCDALTMKRCPHRKCLTTMSPDHVVRVIERIVADPKADAAQCKIDVLALTAAPKEIPLKSSSNPP